MLLVSSALSQPIDRITRNVKHINTFISEVFFFERPEEFRMGSAWDHVRPQEDRGQAQGGAQENGAPKKPRGFDNLETICIIKICNI